MELRHVSKYELCLRISFPFHFLILENINKYIIRTMFFKIKRVVLMRNIIISVFLTLLLSVASYAQYKEPKLRNNLNIYKKERKKNCNID